MVVFGVTVTANSPYFCVDSGMYEQSNKAENGERAWKEALKIHTVCFVYVMFIRITLFSQPRAIPIG